MSGQEQLKREAAAFALQHVTSGMRIGLGSGSTSSIFVDLLAERLSSGELNDIQAVPTSLVTAERAGRQGIPLITLTSLTGERNPPWLDLAVDGADEVDQRLNLIKGLGYALLREKIVETHARQFIVIVDESKLSDRLCRRVPLPVEIVQFEFAVHLGWLSRLAKRVEPYLRADGSPVVTDNGNYMALCWFEAGLEQPEFIARQLAERPGIVEHGIFLGMASRVVCAGQAGIRVLEKTNEG